MKNLRPQVTNPLKSVRVVLGPKLSLGDNEQTGSPQNKRCLVNLVEVLVNLGDVLLSRTSCLLGGAGSFYTVIRGKGRFVR